VSSVYPLTFAGAEIDDLIIGQDLVNESPDVAEPSDILYGANIRHFTAEGPFETNPDGSILQRMDVF